MALFILFMETILIVFIDRKIYGTYFTPSIVLSVPFLAVASIACLYAVDFGFYPVYLPSLYVWCFGLFFFWVTGYLISTFALKKSIIVSTFKSLRFQLSVKEENFLREFSLLISVLVDLYIFRILKGNSFIITEELASYLGTGLVAHMAVLMKFLTVYAIYKMDKKISISNLKYLFIILSSVFYSICLTGKGGLILVLLSGFIFKLLLTGKKFRLSYIFYLLLLAFAIFFTIYSIIFQEPAQLSFIANHVFFYFTSSTGGLSQYIATGQPVGLSWELLFMPLINAYNKISGKELEMVVSDLWTVIGPDKSTNVKTFFGTIYVYGGVVRGAVTVIIWSIVCHLTLFIAIRKNIFFMINYAILLAALALGWFDCFFNMISFYEYLFYAILLQFLMDLYSHSQKCLYEN